MTGIPHPYFVILDSERRRTELHAEADRYRLLDLANGRGNRRRRFADLAAVMALAMALVFVLASIATPEEPPRRAVTQADAPGANTVTQVMDKHLLDPSAVQKIDATRL